MIFRADLLAWAPAGQIPGLPDPGILTCHENTVTLTGNRAAIPASDMNITLMSLT